MDGTGWCGKGHLVQQDHHMEVTRFRKVVLGLLTYPAVGVGFVPLSMLCIKQT